jgi:hypothetical protein
MATGALTGNTKTAEQIFEQLTQAGVSRFEAQIVVANWILGNAGIVPRLFEFKTPFGATAPDCAGQFAQSFFHKPWSDGNNVVQAEQTPGEEGFNLRFQRIEADLDSLGRDVAQAFVCINAMRASLRALLDELQAEINLIHQRAASGPRGGGGIFIDPANAGNVIGGGGGVFGGGNVIGGNFLGTTKFFGKDVHVFETSGGRVMLPAVEGLTITPFDNPRVRRAQVIGEFVTTPEVQQAFATGAGMAKSVFVDRFGTTVLSNGETVRDALEIVPGELSLPSPQGVLDQLAVREGAAIRTSGLERDSIAATFRLTGSARVADAPLDRMELVPPAARAALVRLGVPTVAEFVKRDPAEMTRALQGQGVDVRVADVAGWRGAGRALMEAA